jgi:hypothetical protein
MMPQAKIVGIGSEPPVNQVCIRQIEQIIPQKQGRCIAARSLVHEVRDLLLDTTILVSRFTIWAAFLLTVMPPPHFFA